MRKKNSSKYPLKIELVRLRSLDVMYKDKYVSDFSFLFFSTLFFYLSSIVRGEEDGGVSALFMYIAYELQLRTNEYEYHLMVSVLTSWAFQRLIH